MPHVGAECVVAAQMQAVTLCPDHEAQGNARASVCCMQIYPTSDFPTFDAALVHFMKEAGVTADEVFSCCIACAGPVLNNKCTMTNLQWTVDGETIEQHHGFRTQVLCSTVCRICSS